MTRNLTILPALCIMIAIACSCGGPKDPNTEMAELLHNIYLENETPKNVFSAGAQKKYFDSLCQLPGSEKNLSRQFARAFAYLQYGDEKKAIEFYKEIYNEAPKENFMKIKMLMQDMALAYLRLGERANCMANHSGESCIFPIKGGGIHGDPTGSQHAIDIYKSLLVQFPNDLEVKWLLNIAYMTIGGYPHNVPKEYLIEMPDDTAQDIKPFVDAAMKTGLNVNNVSGTSIFEDFNNDGYLDLVTSSMSLIEGLSYFINNGDGTFSDASKVSGLSQLTGGLNIQQTDYDNDGFKDIFVMRGGWKSTNGKEPNSLIRNNGDGTFTDVTKKSGLMSFYPCMASNWADVNGDGWLDLFLCNEPIGGTQSPSQLFISNRNGTFTDCAKESNVQLLEYSKGVATGDFNNDGLIDMYVCAMTGQKHLFKNTGNDEKGRPIFKEVSREAGITDRTGCFSTWFWDFDNDGHLDLLNCLYKNDAPIAYFAAAEAIGQGAPKEGTILLYRNNGDGTFQNVSKQMGLYKVFFSMGSNYGDVDNDGFLDFYIATGNPDFNALLPNKLFRNMSGKGFTDITGSARVGSIQKSHGTSFADVDNDGDEDLYIEQGGPFEGDAYQNAFFINPGQNNNHWVKFSLKGVKANAAGIGAKIKVSFKENNVQRSVYRQVCVGSSYGANPLTHSIGIGSADKIDSVEIIWPGSGTKQYFTNLQPDKSWVITEGQPNPVEQRLRKLDFLDPNRLTIGCAPLTVKK